MEWENNHSPIVRAQLNYPQLPKEIHSVSFGNPHGICIVEDLNKTNVPEWGKILTKDPMFPNEANISFVQIVDRQNIKLRVYERGVGPTLACGSAACAAVIVGQSLNLLDNTVNVSFQVGELLININPQKNTLSMTGPAKSVYIGRFKI